MSEDPTEDEILDALAPKSDQLNADDLIGRKPFTVTIVHARSAGKGAEQPWTIEFTDCAFADGRAKPWKPSKSMRRLLVAAWGTKMREWRGRRVTLYLDPDVRFGKDVVGGIRVSHLSHLPNDRPLTVNLTVTRGKKAPWTVKPVPATAPPATSFYDQLLALINSGVVTKVQVHAALNQRRAAEVPASEHAAILARLQAVQQTVPDSAAQEGEE